MRDALYQRQLQRAAANFHSGQPTITPDGQWLFFVTGATDVVTPDTNGNTWDVVRRNRVSEVAYFAMRNALGAQPNADCFYPRVSRDGRYVAYISDATT